MDKDYHDKYLKYKSKYCELKNKNSIDNQIGGGNKYCVVKIRTYYNDTMISPSNGSGDWQDIYIIYDEENKKINCKMYVDAMVYNKDESLSLNNINFLICMAKINNNTTDYSVSQNIITEIKNLVSMDSSWLSSNKFKLNNYNVTNFIKIWNSISIGDMILMCNHIRKYVKEYNTNMLTDTFLGKQTDESIGSIDFIKEFSDTFFKDLNIESTYLYSELFNISVGLSKLNPKDQRITNRQYKLLCEAFLPPIYGNNYRNTDKSNILKTEIQFIELIKTDNKINEVTNPLLLRGIIFTKK